MNSQPEDRVNEAISANDLFEDIQISVSMLDMVRRTIAFLLCASAVLMPIVPSAQDSDHTPRDEFIMNAWAEPSDCIFEKAKNVAFSDLASDAGELVGECVAVEGFWQGRALFRSAWHAKMRRSNTNEQLRRKRIGLYAQWEKIGEPSDQPARSVFVGIVGRCETQWPDAMMVLGYCHYTGGSILLVSQRRPA